MAPFEMVKSEAEHDRPRSIQLFTTCTLVTMVKRKRQNRPECIDQPCLMKEVVDYNAMGLDLL